MENKQLFEKRANDYNPFFPIVRLKDITDTISDKSVQWILNNYNHIYVEYSESKAITRNKVPTLLRRKGLWVSYNIGKQVITEYYIGDNNDITNYKEWTADINWKKFNEADILDDSITYKHLSESLKQLIGEGNTITNFPNEEDITTNDNMLSFKDRNYEPDKFSGLGKVILRKNIIVIDGQPKNILTQDMVSKENTIYVIQYDFDLNGEEITIPKNCVLDFQGGSLNNGKINFNETYIQGLANIQTEIGGIIANENLDIRWFGCTGDGVFDNSDILQKIIDFTEGYSNRVYIYIPDGIWGIGKTLKFKESFGNIKGNNPSTSTIKAIAEMDWMFSAKEDAEYSNPYITNISLDGGMEGDFYKNSLFNEDIVVKAKGGINFPRFWYTFFNNIRLKNIAGTAFKTNEIWNVNVENIFIQRCHTGLELGMGNGVCISNCEFNTISRYGIYTKVWYTLDIRNNIFEVIGNCAVFGYCSGVGQISINSNYFEKCSINGIETFNFTGKTSYGTIHSNVIITGRHTPYGNQINNGGTGNPCVVIKGNSLQESANVDNACAFYISNCSSLEIDSNIIANQGWDLFGFNLNTGVKIKDVYIRNNNIIELGSDGFGETPIHWSTIKCYNDDGYGSIQNIITDSKLKHRDVNLMKYLMFYAYGLKAFKATGETYNEHSVYTCDEEISLFIRKGLDGINVSDEPLNESPCLVTYYISEDNVIWSKITKLSNTILANIKVKTGNYFTIPTIQYLDRTAVDEKEYPINAPTFEVFKTTNIDYKEGSVINITKDSNYSQCIYYGKGGYELVDKNGNILYVEGVSEKNKGSIRFDKAKNVPVFISNSNLKKNIHVDKYGTTTKYASHINYQSIRIEFPDRKSDSVIELFIKEDNSRSYYYKLYYTYGVIYLLYTNTIYTNTIKASDIINENGKYVLYLQPNFKEGQVNITINSYISIKDSNGMVIDDNINTPSISKITTIDENIVLKDVSLHVYTKTINLSTNRPTEAAVGCQIFDLNSKKPVWWTGEKWVDATGADV